MSTLSLSFSHSKQVLYNYYRLTKPKVVLVMVITSALGMVLVPSPYQNMSAVFFGLLGIACASAGAAAFNHLFESNIDSQMSRTAKRPLASDQLSGSEVKFFAGLCVCLAFVCLWAFTNPTATVTTMATTLGYAYIYTQWLKPSSPQNIVIGGLSGAMPPLLGWLCLKPSFDIQPLLLTLIIFLWTPAHFWPLAIHFKEDYQQSGLPMLPITHGIPMTHWSIMAYTLLSFLACLLPYCLGMFAEFYLTICVTINIRWLWLNYQCTQDTSRWMQSFRFSIQYLLILFAAMLVDHKFSAYLLS